MEAMFYSVGQMSEILGITERSVYRSKEQIPGYVKISGRVYFRISTFEKMTQGTQKPAERAVPVSDRHGLI